MGNVSHEWSVTLNVFGPITVKKKISFIQRKEIDLKSDRIYSNIEVVKNSRYGISLTVTAFAGDLTTAKKFALYFCGQALDVLSYKINLPIILSLKESQNLPLKIQNERRILTEEELVGAFKNARLWVLTESTFLRALGWYRKGLYTEDAFDKFLAFYNSIEILCSKYNPHEEKCKNKGSKCHIWETFKDIWGECKEWPIIPNQLSWIDKNYETRKDIAHGVASIDVNVVEEILEKIEIIQQVTFKLIVDREKKLNPIITEKIQSKLI